MKINQSRWEIIEVQTSLFAEKFEIQLSSEGWKVSSPWKRFKLFRRSKKSVESLIDVIGGHSLRWFRNKQKAFMMTHRSCPFKQFQSMRSTFLWHNMVVCYLPFPSRFGTRYFLFITKLLLFVGPILALSCPKKIWKTERIWGTRNEPSKASGQNLINFSLPQTWFCMSIKMLYSKQCLWQNRFLLAFIFCRKCPLRQLWIIFQAGCRFWWTCFNWFLNKLRVLYQILKNSYQVATEIF